MSVVGIKDIIGYVPDDRMDVSSLLEKFSVDSKFIESKTGGLFLARAAVEETTTDLAAKALELLLDAHPNLRSNIGLLIVVTQTPDHFGLPHISARVHGRFNLPKSVAAFDISLACSGWVYALSICRSFMQAEGIAHGVIVTADPYSKIVNPDDRDTAMLFGDAATATLLVSHKPIWTIGRGVFGTDGSLASSLERRAGGFLHMNGRRVFEFSATVIPPCIEAVLKKNAICKADIDVFLMHQGSRYIVDTIGDRIDALARTPYLASQVGNTVSSSIPLAMFTSDFSNKRRVLVAGFGVGLSWAANILEKTDD